MDDLSAGLFDESNSCPKHMVFGPCGGVRPDASCEFDPRPCPFASRAVPVQWPSSLTPPAHPGSRLLEAAARGPVVITDLTLPPYDAAGLAEVVDVLATSSDALLVGEHQNSPDFPPTLLAVLIRRAGGNPWITLTCRDRNRLVLEQELEGLRFAQTDGVLCVTGDGRAHGVRPGVTQVFDLDGTRLAALAAQAGHSVAVPESPSAAPQHLRPARLVQKQLAGAHVAILNHVARPADVSDFVSAARALGLTIPVIAAVAVFTDERSLRGLQGFPGLELDRARCAAVLDAVDSRSAGIESAATEAEKLLDIAGVVGVNLSGAGSGSGVLAAAEVKAEVAQRIKDAR